MDPFRRCVQDLESITRLLELPHGHDIAFEMFRELLPYIWQLTPLMEHDPSRAVSCLLDYAEGIRLRLGCSQFESCIPPKLDDQERTPRVA